MDRYRQERMGELGAVVFAVTLLVVFGIAIIETRDMPTMARIFPIFITIPGFVVMLFVLAAEVRRAGLLPGKEAQSTLRRRNPTPREKMQNNPTEEDEPPPFPDRQATPIADDNAAVDRIPQLHVLLLAMYLVASWLVGPFGSLVALGVVLTLLTSRGRGIPIGIVTSVLTALGLYVIVIQLMGLRTFQGILF